MHRARRWARACLLTAAATAAVAPHAHAAPTDVPTPTVSGPVPVTATSRPFLATDQDLGRYGYVEREYFVTGNASTYSPVNTLATASKVISGGPNGDGTYPFKTRIVVRRPIDDADFNGTTLLEWNNVTAGFDIEWNWLNDPDYLMRHGYAWVGVSAQLVGVAGGPLVPQAALKNWDAARYGDLDVTSSAGAGDPLSYDIFGSVAKAVRGLGAGRDPLGELRTKRIVATGESQSGSRLNVYYNAIQPLHELIDGFLITVAGGASPPAPQAPGVLRTDRPQDKAIRVLTDFENAAPPADPDHAGYRRWDVAGGSHLPFKAYTTFAPIVSRDLPGIPATADCELPALSRVAWPYVYNRALDALVTWSSGGAAPPMAPRFEFDGGTIRRDEHGITRGGIRLPEVEVPTATNSGSNKTKQGATSLFSNFCRLLGSSVPFAQDKLDGLYDDYGDYVDAVAPKTQAVRDAGFITADDVERVNADAARFARLRPEEPKLAAGTTTPNRGTFALGWRGPDPIGTATTYAVERRSGAPDAAWTAVPGADALAARQLAREDEPEGTHTYRVRSTTLVPPLYPDPQRVETTSWSDASESVKVDRSAPPAPTPTPARAPEHAGDGGWFRDGVRVSFAAAGDAVLPDGTPGVGLDPASVPGPVDVASTRVVSGTVKDVAGNTSLAGSRTIQVDAAPPVVSVGCPTGAVQIGAKVTVRVAAADAPGGSGLAADPSGTVQVDTRKAGTQTIARTATDRVGHTATASCAVRVVPKTAVTCKARGGKAQRKVSCAVKLAAGTRTVKIRVARGGRTVATRTVRRSGTVTLGSRLAKGRYDLTVSIDGATTQRRRLTV